MIAFGIHGHRYGHGFTPVRWRRRRTALAEVTERVLVGEPGDEVLRLIAHRLRELLGADLARIMVLEPGDVLAVRATDGTPDAIPRGLLTPGGSAPARRAIRAGRPTVSGGEPERPNLFGLFRRVPHDTALACVLDAPLLVRGQTAGVIEVATRRGGRRLTRADVKTVRMFAEPAGLAVARLRGREQLRRVAATAAAAAGQGSVRRALDSLAAAAVARTTAASCTVYLLEPGPGAVLRMAGGGHGHTPPSRGTALEAIAGATPVIRHGGTGTREAPARGAVAAWPLLRGTTVIGAMCCHFPAGRRPGETDMAVLEVIAGHAACAVETDRQRAAARETAVREERQRVSRELHDSVSQALYGIALGARTARELLERDLAEPTGVVELAQLAEPIEYIRRLADVAIAETRTLLCQLRPESLEAEGLVAALTQHVETLRDRYGITAEATFGSEPETTPEAKHALYRIAQESLHNIAKHSRARNVTLHLLSGPDTVTLTVADDGVGFDSQGTFPGHLGLLSMHERAREVGGTLLVDSRPGQGSRIRATVPAEP
ncbi:GAF domain-containing sensor histidine kinase [Streptomyces sp. NBRC 110028]|uniref:GAF domain-containing sensor histidine kinase n=1 Tax=Streptomyces sp. NBRC 110028 TaxID=1621260 RepID=UPI00131B2BE8|nr:GAF domain-containing sensor histidine kinase [Streptomyces sp. NBRC 110028]